MKKSLLLLIITLTCIQAQAQTTFPYNGFNLMPVPGYYAELGLNTYWHGTNGWSYLSNGPCVKLRMGEWNYASDFIFETAPVNTNGFDAPITLTEVLRIKQNGNVGIGTSQTGDHKLAVEGSIAARRVKVLQQGWADFVFSSGYQLPSLHDVELHVKRYHHLPGIPPASVIAKDGLDLGEMQQKQLQKIEELTLYLIDLNKKVESQQEIIQQQQKELAGLRKSKQ